MFAKQTVTSDEAARLLIEGNARFAAGKPERPYCTPDRRMEVASGQSPFAAILSCSDSWVPPEIVFDRGIGDLFVVRVAGHVIDSAVIGSLALAVNHFGCPLVVVLGHENCGAIKVALSPDELLIREPVQVIKMAEIIRECIPAALAARTRGDADVTEAVREHTAASVQRIAEKPFIAERIAEGLVRVIPAYYSLATGVVSW
jgi:carbonic anhydrase